MGAIQLATKPKSWMQGAVWCLTALELILKNAEHLETIKLRQEQREELKKRSNRCDFRFSDGTQLSLRRATASEARDIEALINLAP